MIPAQVDALLVIVSGIFRLGGGEGWWHWGRCRDLLYVQLFELVA